MSIKVTIVEDDLRTRQSLEALLRVSEGFQCVGTFPNGEQALAEIPKSGVDVVLMDINLPGMSGVECTRQLKLLCPEIQIVMLTVYDDGDRIFQALQQGASGYLLKRAPADEILRAIEEVRRGGAPMSSYIARMVVQSFQSARLSSPAAELLTKREENVLEYVARGYANKQIAEALGLTNETVRTYLKKIYQKLHVRSRTEAAMKFIER